MLRDVKNQNGIQIHNKTNIKKHRATNLLIMKRITLFITLLLLISISAIAQTVYKAGERKTTFANGDKVIIYSTCNKGTHDAIITRDNTSGQRTDGGVEVAVPNSEYLSLGNSVWIIEIIEEHEGEPVVAFKRINDNKYWYTASRRRVTAAISFATGSGM